MKFLVYATFEQMHGRKSSIYELVDKLKAFSRESVLYTCAVTGMVLKIWDNKELNCEAYDLFLTTSFDPLRGDWYRLSARTEQPEVVVHRRQLLLLTKLAIEHCPTGGDDLLRAAPGQWGTLLLMANDQFHYGLHPPVGKGNNERDKVARVMTEFAPVTEYAGLGIEHRVARSHLMMTEYVKRNANHPDFIDVAATYQNLTSISLGDFEALTFGLFARCNLVTLEGLQTNPWLAAVSEENFRTTAISHETIRAFISEFAASSAELKTEIEVSRKKERDYGANDFTVLRKRPLVIESYGMLPTDLALILEKFETGPYWRINDMNRETGEKLRRFWGAVFETYVNDQMTEAPSRGEARFIPDPRWANRPSEQVCDGLLIEGDALVLIEYKSSMFSARSKYGGNHLRLLDEIVAKLIRNDEKGKKKGVEQLADAAKRLLTKHSANAVDGLDLGPIRKVFPLLVTLDGLGGNLLMSRFLNGYFTEFLGNTSIEGAKLQPLFCTDITSLEEVLPFCDVCPLSGFLEHWLSKDPTLMATLLAHPPEGLPPRRNEILYETWEKLSEDIERRLFPSQHLAAGTSP